MAKIQKLSNNDQLFLKNLRAIAIFIIVFGHVGGFWFAQPYSSFLLTVVPIFFFISGGVSFYSYQRSINASRYITKRLIKLLVPYYLACVVVLIFFCVERLKLPDDIVSIIKWLTVTPTAKEMPFLFSQVWFLRVLLMLSVVSPLLFELHKRNNKITLTLVLPIMALSAVQPFYNIGRMMSIIDKRLYIFIVDMIFFVSGFYYFTNKTYFTKKILSVCLSLFVLCSIIFVKFFGVKPSLHHHEYYPDLYYVLVSFATISFFLIFGKNILIRWQQGFLLSKIFDFLHFHTFSIFLLHGLGLYIADNLFKIILPFQYKHHDIKYGLTMLFITMLATCFISIPFTKLSSKCQRLFFAKPSRG